MFKERSIVNTSVFILAILVAVSFAYRYRPVSAPATLSVTAPLEKAAVSEAPAVNTLRSIASARVISNPVSDPTPNSTPVPVVPPTLLSRVLPVYPSGAQTAGIEGTVVIRALVSVSGMVESVEIKTSSGSGLLDSSAADAISKWEFSPATRAGAVLASWYEVPVRFALED
ncbi:MAG: TonB family protein [Candidatus Margulisbacteria bacterium]|nr:TonB family protein [Candidatus Margulisiibacteriota bacterium]